MFTNLNEFKTAVAVQAVRQVVLVEQSHAQAYSLLQGERCIPQVADDRLVLTASNLQDEFDLTSAEVQFRGHMMKVANAQGDFTFVINPIL